MCSNLLECLRCLSELAAASFLLLDVSLPPRSLTLPRDHLNSLVSKIGLIFSPLSSLKRATEKAVGVVLVQ